MVALDNTYGAFLIGIVVAAVLYGCICVQAMYYYMHYPADWWYFKFLVGGVLISETCHQVLLTHSIYATLVTHFGDVAGLEKIIASPIIAMFFSGFTTLFVQSFLVMRVYRLSKKSWLATGAVMIAIVAEFVVVCVVASKALRLTTVVQLVTLKNLTIAFNSIAAAGDFFIAILLCFLLHRSRTGFRKSDTMIDRLIIFSINTGLLTSLCAIATLICITVLPYAFIYLAFYVNVGRLYGNSLLIALNVRRRLTGESDNENSSIYHESQRMAARSKCGTSSSRPIPNNISIKVDTTHESIHDEQSSFE